MMNTTQFFAMKINRYMHEFGITQATLAKVAAKNYRNGALNPNAWRQKPWNEEEILASPTINYPLTHYMFCSPDEGGAAVVMCRADQAKKYTDRPIYLRAAEIKTRRFGAFEVFSPWLPIERTDSPTVDAAKATFEAAGIVAIRRAGCADPGLRSGGRDHAHGRERLLRRRRPGSDDRER